MVAVAKDGTNLIDNLIVICSK